MENVVLIIHLLLATALIVVVLMQRSEGGGLGIGGGSSGGIMSSRGAASALAKLTWIFAAAFLTTSIALTIISAQNARNSSVVDRLGTEAPVESTAPALPTGEDLLPPSTTDETTSQPRAD